MKRPDWRAPLTVAFERSLSFLEGLPERPVGPQATAAQIRASLGELSDAGRAPDEIVRSLAAAVEPGLSAMPSGRFFGWVIGGGLPAAIAADWMTVAWDQNAGSHQGTPSAAAVEQVAIAWVLELLDLPRHASAALVTGAQMANTVCLAAARNAVLAEHGWNVEADGLCGAPRINVLVGGERHDTVMRSLRLLGLGAARAEPIDTDDNGRMRPSLLAKRLPEIEGPVIVCAQAGNVSTGGMDPLAEIADVVAARRARSGKGDTWLHVDGAFGLWARASRTLRARATGAERADSWATDGHKWPNVPYDCGIAIVAHPLPHRRAMAMEAAYLPASDDGERSPFDWTPELSRRARGFALYAALAELGRSGMEDLVDRCCAHARTFRDRLSSVAGVEVLNEVELNQVLVRFTPVTGDPDAHTRAVTERIAKDGTCFASGTTWRGKAALRISVSNWSTDESDVERSIEAIVRAHRAPLVSQGYRGPRRRCATVSSASPASITQAGNSSGSSKRTCSTSRSANPLATEPSPSRGSGGQRNA